MKKVKIILLTGNLVFSLTPYIYFEKGRAPSLDIAKAILVVTVKCENPPRYTLIRRKIVIVNEPARFLVPSADVKAISKTLITGWSVRPLATASILLFMA